MCRPPCRPRQASISDTTSRPEPTRKRAPIIPALLMLLVAFASCGGGWMLFRSRDVVTSVTSHSWSRVQHVEEYTALSQDGWDKPADAYNVRVERLVHHHDRVLDHHETKTRIVYDRVPDGTERVRTGTRTTSLGNGRFKREPTYSTRTKYRTVARTERYQDPVYRSDPVYRDYYLYTVDRWLPGQDRREQGVGIDPRWPSTAVRDAKQRMGSREESYSILFTERSPEPGDQARTWSRSFDEAAWRSWRDGMTVVVTVRLGSVIDIRAAEVEAAAKGASR